MWGRGPATRQRSTRIGSPKLGYPGRTKAGVTEKVAPQNRAISIGGSIQEGARVKTGLKASMWLRGIRGQMAMAQTLLLNCS